jgi:hypothetical protein
VLSDRLQGLLKSALGVSFCQEIKTAQHGQSGFEQSEKFLIENQEIPQR